LLVLAAGCTRAPRELSFSYERFGTVHVYLPKHPQGAAMLLSGDAGWNGEAVALARTLAGGNVLVLGVDLPVYLKTLAGSWDRELYPEADLEALSQFAQKKLALPSYLRPVLVGYGAGATAAGPASTARSATRWRLKESRSSASARSSTSGHAAPPTARPGTWPASCATTRPPGTSGR
jgi:type IV secretory pathway VirJ component